MTIDRAKYLLREIWGDGKNITPEIADEISKERNIKLPEPEAYIDILQRIVGDDYNWRSEPNWNVRNSHYAN